MDLFEIIGIVGILLFCIAVLTRNKKKQDIYFILGGLCMELYSIAIKNTIFIILQLIFLVSTIWDLVRKN